MHNFNFIVKNQVFMGVQINIWVLNSIPLVNMSVFMPTPSCFHCCNSIIELVVTDGDASGSSLIEQVPNWPFPIVS